MTIILFLLALILPPPWVPPQPVTLPLVVEYAGDGTLTTIARGDGAIVSFTPHTARACFWITARDAAGQQYQYQQQRDCGRVVWLPWVVQQSPDAGPRLGE